MEDLKTKKYGDLYNHLCSAQFIADEIGDDLADEILRIREKIGKKLLDEYGIKYDLEKEVVDYIYTLPHSRTGIPGGWKCSWNEEEVIKIVKHFLKVK